MYIMLFYLIPVFLPCISSITVGLLGTKFGKIGTYIVSIINLFISCFFSIILLYDIIVFENTTIINLGNWINLEVFKLDWVFIFDPLSVVMCTVVLLVSFLVHIYSINYMGDDPHVPRFFSYLTLFTFFMLLLVVSENLVLFYFGWEGIGLTSFLLINFWTTRIAANKAALKAIIVNRFGDLGLLMGNSTLLLGI
jgi:NADH:ubiquinone oxidoreductase subunit 5 (subunit L)/multisubunit Na+/H+ antiporter MnhA subunit